MAVYLFSQKARFRVPPRKKTITWLKRIARKEGATLGELNVIFCSDQYLLGLNRQYLRHNFYTDVITFETEGSAGRVSGEVYISIDRVRANATLFHKSFTEELHRVMAHGLLHLLGYSDKSRPQKAKMQEKEEASLSLRRI